MRSLVATLSVAAVAPLPHLTKGFLFGGLSTQWKIRRQTDLRRPSVADATSAATAMCGSREPQVALTREAGKNDKLAALLRDAGISSVEIPCIAHEDGPDLPSLPSALQETPGLVYVVITSPEAAKVFLNGWKAGGSPNSVPVACVGAATGQALEKGGITPVFTPSKATGDTLAAEIPIPDGSIPPRVVLYPASVKASNQLEDGLRARGFEVRRLNTYNTVSAQWDADDATGAKRASVAAFGSPSAVKTWAERVGAFGSGPGGVGEGAIAACIGNTSATACRKAGWPEGAIFYPESPGMDGWAKAVSDALAAVGNSS